jgi:predicted nucleic acid-binding Zn ribbon protein
MTRKPSGDRPSGDKPLGNTPGRRLTAHPSGGSASHRPEAVGDVLKSFLKESGLDRRVEQSSIVPEWPGLVGQAIAAETEPLYVTADGTLFVAVRTNAWMTELQLMTPELLRALSRGRAGTPRNDITKLRFVLQRP